MKPLWKYISVILVFYFIQINYTAQCQNYYFDNYSVKEGLAQSTVYDIHQDLDGFLWLGTSAGVSKFDGINFKNYTFKDGLGKNAVQKIIQDKNGNLWFGHKGGFISRLKDDSLQSFKPDTTSADITVLTEDYLGNIWVGTNGVGAFKIKNPDSQNLSNADYIPYKEELGKFVFSIYHTMNHELYFIINNGIKKFNFESSSFSDYKPKNLPQFFQYTCMFEDSKRHLWFGTHLGGVYKSNNDGSYKKFRAKDGLAGNWISCINEDENNNIWIGTWGKGISLINKDGILNFNLNNGLPDLKIRCIKTDFEGNVLIGTQENGLCIYKGDGFINYSNKDGIRGKQVHASLQDSEGNYWFGTDNGLTIIPVSNNNLETPVYFNIENEKIPENRIRFIKEDKKGTIWVAGEKSIVSKSKDSNEFDYNFLVNGYIKQTNTITAFDIDKFNSLWIGTLDGLFVYDINNDLITQLNENHGLIDKTISALYVDSKQRVWIGFEQKGINVFTPKDSTFTKVEVPFGFTAVTFTESPDNKIWVGTQSQGIFIYNGLEFEKQLKSSDGLISDNITALYSAINDNIYIGTSRGLNKYDLEKNRFSSYSSKTGFTGIEVKKNSGHIDKNGNVWLGTVNGATRINLSKNKERKLEPKTIITKLRVNLKERGLNDKLVFSHTENSIIFDYISVCLSDPNAVTYKTMLEGAQDSWQPETKQTTASFPGLAPGKYTFKIIAKNNAGVWNKTPIKISFKINPPFWKSIVFYIVTGVILLILIFVYIKVRERKLIVEKKILEDKVDERTKEISQKNKELVLFNKKITGSIQYAKRIQDAMLPSHEHLNEILPEHFIYYKPRDIVSGDYYWATKKDDLLIIAVVDCTGHGVPGAFMSMLGMTLLDEIINKKNITDTAKVLNLMRKSVIKALKQKGQRGETQDGMDIALCAINTKDLSLQFSGAYNPLYLIRDNELIKYKADRMPIGIYYKQKKEFKSHTIQLEKNDKIYLFTDGYIDQFNEFSGEKLMTRNFSRYLLKSNHLPMESQVKYLNKKLKDWQGKIEQVDDILIIGLKIDFISAN